MSKEKIAKKLEEVYAPGEVAGGHIYKGWDFDGIAQSNGWWFQPFGRQPIYMGKSVEEAILLVEIWKDQYEQMNA